MLTELETSGSGMMNGTIAEDDNHLGRFLNEEMQIRKIDMSVTEGPPVWRVTKTMCIAGPAAEITSLAVMNDALAALIDILNLEERFAGESSTTEKRGLLGSRDDMETDAVIIMNG